jgi:uncharacterized protein
VTFDFNSAEMLQAVEAIENRHYSDAFELLLPLAATGNPKAQLNLATLYHFGWGVEADGEKAVALYIAAAEQRISDEHVSSLAYHNLSTLYIGGCPGVAPNWESALKYCQLAKDLGFEM